MPKKSISLSPEFESICERFLSFLEEGQPASIRDFLALGAMPHACVSMLKI